MRHKPLNNYCGLTIILSNPSRQDIPSNKLLSGYAGEWFNTECLQPECTRYQCDIRTADTKSEGLLAGTNKVLLLGDKAFHEYCPGNEKYHLSAQRGYWQHTPLTPSHFDCLATFSPQDAMDIIDYEGKLNPLADHSEDDDREEEEGNEKDFSGTRRKNYRFWIKRDVKKLLKVTQEDLLKRMSYSPIIYPSTQQIIHELKTNVGKDFYLDIETDSNYNIICFSFCFNYGITFCVPIIRYDYTLAYSIKDICKIYQALESTLYFNRVIVHNALYDLLILSWKYGIGVGRNIYDTMLAHQRCFVGVEKSLGHAMSHLTDFPYHKDEGIFMPKNPEQERKLWMYNAKDVIGMREVKKSIDAYSITIAGLEVSIEQVNRSIRPYLINSLNGIRYDKEKLIEMLATNDRKLTQMVRIIKILVGKDTDLLPTSSKSCVEYFHNRIGLPIVGRSKTISKKTGLPMNTPKLDEVNILKLKLKVPDNVVLDCVLEHRGIVKESGSLGFNQWREYALE